MKTLAAALAALSLSLAAAPAVAQRRPASLRVLGFGTGLGVGYDVNSFGGDHAWPLLPTLSLHVALTPRVELELWAPAVNLVASRIGDIKGWLWADLTARWYALEPSRGLFVQAGVGFMRGRFNDDPAFAVLRVPARVGWEFSTDGRGAALQLGVRPWVDVVFPGDPLGVAARFGFVAEVGFNFYVTREP